MNFEETESMVKNELVESVEKCVGCTVVNGRIHFCGSIVFLHLQTRDGKGKTIAFKMVDEF